MTTFRSTLRVSAVFAVVAAAAWVPGSACAQTSDATDPSTHIGGSTGTGETGSGGSSPSLHEMHAPGGPSVGGSTGTGKTSHHGRLAPRHMHAPAGSDIGGSVGTGRTGSDRPGDRS